MGAPVQVIDLFAALKRSLEQHAAERQAPKRAIVGVSTVGHQTAEEIGQYIERREARDPVELEVEAMFEDTGEE